MTRALLVLALAASLAGCAGSQDDDGAPSFGGGYGGLTGGYGRAPPN